MKKVILFALLLLGSISAQAQFTSGQILTAAALNGQFALYLPLGGGTLTGPLTVPSLSVTGTPIPIASGGTGANTATGATANLQYADPGANSQARAVSKKLGDMLSLTDYCSASQMAASVNTCFANAVTEAASTGQAIWVPAGNYMETADFVITTNNIEIRCDRGAIFTKGSAINNFWLKGTNQAIRNCEVNGASYDGTGYIVDSTATNAVLDRVISHNNGVVSSSDASGAAGILNSGTNTRIIDPLTYANAGGGLENSNAINVVVDNPISYGNGAEGITYDNPSQKGGVQIGGVVYGNCAGAGGVGNIGVDGATGLKLIGLVVHDPNPQCPYNITAQNNVGNTVGLSIIGGYGYGAGTADVIFKKTGSYSTQVSSVVGFSSYSSAGSVVVPNGSTGNYLDLDNFVTGPVISDTSTRYRLGGGALFTSQVSLNGGALISPTSGDGDMVINSVSGNTAAVQYQKAGTLRWSVQRNNATETGSNVGSDLLVTRYNDSGASIDNPFYITRSTGLVNVVDGLSVAGGLQSYNGTATAGNGQPIIVATPDFPNQSASLPNPSLLYSVPAGQGGRYRITMNSVVTTPATTSSTLPNINIAWTDALSNGTPNANIGSSSTGNSLNSVSVGSITVRAKAGTAINASSATAYASTGATAMVYDADFVVEYLGP